MRRGVWGLLVFLALPVPRAIAEPSYITFPSDISWSTRESEHFRILYRDGEAAFAERALRSAEKAHKMLAPIFQETPPVTWIVLADFQDSMNGYAIDYPFPHMVLFASPPDASGQLAALDSWLDSLVLHEYVHVLHLYPAHGFWSVMRSIFGAWVLPNGMLPSHLHEGLATFMETHLTRGGRGRGASFGQIRRMAVKEKVWGTDFAPMDLLEGSLRWPQGISPYFFGYHLYRELWERKKQEGIHSFVQKTSRGWPYLLSTATEEVYGADYPSLWKSVFDKTGEETKREIAAIEKQPLSGLRYLTETGFHKWDLAASPTGLHLAYKKIHPDTGTTLEILPVDKTHKPQSVEMESGKQDGLCWLPRGNSAWLVFTESEYANGYDTAMVRVRDVEAGATFTPRAGEKSLSHVLTLGCGAETVWTYEEVSGRGKVREWSISPDAKQWTAKREWKVPEGAWVSSIVGEPSPLLAVRLPQSTAIYRWGGGPQPHQIAEFPGHFYRFQKPLPSGEWPVVADISGREEIWALNPEKRRARKLVSLLGGANSFGQNGSKWWVASYRHGGYDIAEADLIDDAGQSLPPAPAPQAPAPEVRVTEGRSYSAWSTLSPKAWMPMFFVVPDGVQLSVWIPAFDISQKHLYDFFGGYDTRGSPFVIGQYIYRFGETQQLAIDADYVPSYLIKTRGFLKQWNGGVTWSSRLGRNLPRLSLGAQFKRVENSYLMPANQSVGFRIGLAHSFWTKTRPRQIAPLRQTSFSLSYSEYFKALGSNDNYWVLQAGLDQYIRSPWYWRHVFKMGLKFGWTEGTVLYNSFFQGGGELVFSMGRGFFLNRGFYPGSFLSQKMFSMNIDYLFPLFEVERGWSYWPFFLRRMEAALTLDVTTQGRFVYYYPSVGLELKSSWKLFFYLPSVFRVGFYHGFGPGEALYFTTAFEASL